VGSVMFCVINLFDISTAHARLSVDACYVSISMFVDTLTSVAVTHLLCTWAAVVVHNPFSSCFLSSNK